MSYDRGRYDRHTAQHQRARYHLRAGMARVALEAKVIGKPAEDSVGRPLLYANEMSQRHGVNTLQRWADGRSTATVLVSGMAFCSRCKRVPTACRCGGSHEA